MSVYKRKGAKTYSYDFWVEGRRFLGRTEETGKRGALAAEVVARKEAELEMAAAEAIDAPRTWELAASRWYLEVGQYHKNKRTDAACLDWLTRAIGRSTALVDIDDNRVAALVAKRRNEFRQVGNGTTPQRKVSAATVNRTMTEPLRKVMLRAAKKWKVRVGDVDWSSHMLAEPQERVREASTGEEAAIMGKLERGYDDAVEFAFLNGCRRMEIIALRWSQVDFFGKQFTVIGKGDKARTIPMSDATYGLLWRQRGNHDELVFTFEALKTRKHGSRELERGKRYPMTEHGLKSAMRRAVPAANVENFRFHDTRHTAASRVLRKSNLRVAQIVLGHEDVKTTTKYAHANAEDVRAALNAASPDKSPATRRRRSAKLLEDRRK